MKLLLDTHAFIWWESDRTQLSGQALAASMNPANTLHLSVASVWEMQIKVQAGKLHLRLPLANMLAEQQDRGFVIVPIVIGDVLALANLPPVHRDPFDRLLVAQARRGGFRLVSRDPLVTQYEVPTLW